MISLEGFKKKAYEDYKDSGRGMEEKYENCVKRKVWGDLSKINKRFIEKYAIPFLKNWGCERPGKFDSKKLADALREIHTCVPEFFVMCDENIREEYGCAANGRGYANFMIRMSLMARDLLSQAGGDKDQVCSRNGKTITVAKALDQYNFAITRRKPNHIEKAIDTIKVKDKSSSENN